MTNNTCTIDVEYSAGTFTLSQNGTPVTGDITVNPGTTDLVFDAKNRSGWSFAFISITPVAPTTWDHAQFVLKSLSNDKIKVEDVNSGLASDQTFEYAIAVLDTSGNESAVHWDDPKILNKA